MPNQRVGKVLKMAGAQAKGPSSLHVLSLAEIHSRSGSLQDGLSLA